MDLVVSSHIDKACVQNLCLATILEESDEVGRRHRAVHEGRVRFCGVLMFRNLTMRRGATDPMSTCNDRRDAVYVM